MTLPDGPTFPGLSKLPSRGALISAKSFWYCGAAVQGAWGAGGHSIRKKGCRGLLLSRNFRERFVWMIQTFESRWQRETRDNQRKTTILSSSPVIFKHTCRVCFFFFFTCGFFGSVFKNKEFCQSRRVSSRVSVGGRSTQHSCGLLPSSRATRRESSALVNFIYSRQTRLSPDVRLRRRRKTWEKPVHTLTGTNRLFSPQWEHKYSDRS